ncbi:DUF2200 family protein [Maribacter arenosus]|uniref:DUF2200 family protein n=1 Tax=Maribacter arenosus TaxID=1854708 RepID=A0ABR7V991_9FLAO|nr:DUF2200 family protein [Maribacter arenosus]MBD0850240.1 DUF2200 family protein [Maribacter arenosus]
MPVDAMDHQNILITILALRKTLGFDVWFFTLKINTPYVTSKQLSELGETNCETFFAQAPQINPDTSKITGVICGHRVGVIKDKPMQTIRYVDKLINELEKGKEMDKILR